jgi:hypothetical protein
MTTPMFAPAAVSCLIDGRSPRPEEIEEVACKIWQDVYARTFRIAWEEVDRGSRLYFSIQAAALAALGAFVSLSTGVKTAAS